MGCRHTGEGPEVTITDPWELLLEHVERLVSLSYVPKNNRSTGTICMLVKVGVATVTYYVVLADGTASE